MAILREIFVKLGLDVDAQAFAKGNIAAEVLKAGFEKVVDVAKETAAQFVENIQATAEYGEKILQLGAASGIGTKSLQQLGKAAAEEGIGIDDFAHSMVLLSRQMSGAKEGSLELQKSFKAAGAQITDGAGKLRPAEDVFLDISEKFHKMEDGADKTALSMKLFGRSGSGMIEFLNRGRDDLEEYLQASVMSDEQLRAGKEVVQVQRQLTAQTRSLWKSAVAPLLPAIRDLLKQYLAWKKANNEVFKANLTQLMKGGIEVVKALGKAFIFAVGALQFFKDNWQIVGALVIGGTTAWALANAGLIASFVRLQATALWAGRTSALAWLKAAAPFAIIGAAVAGLLLIFDDLRRYQWAMENNGGKGVEHTLFGRLNKALDDWNAKFYKTGEQKPAWLFWLELARDALESMRQDMMFIQSVFESPGKTLGEVTSGSWRRFKGMFTEEGDGVPHDVGEMTDKEKRWRMEAQARLFAQSTDRQSLPYTPGMTDAPQAFTDAMGQANSTTYTPMYAPAPGGMSMINRNTVSLQMSFAPGTDAEMVKGAVRDVLVEQGVVTSSDVESATAAASYTPAGG